MGQSRSAMWPVASRLLLAVLLVGVIGTLISWRLVTLNEGTHIQRMTRLATSAVAADLSADMEAWTLAQVRLAKMWEFGEPSYEQWTAFANLYLDHHPGCVAIEWLDPKYEERWITRSQGEKVPLAGNGVLASVFKSAQLSRQPVMSNLLAATNGQKQWSTVVPIYQRDRFRGFVLAFFDTQRSFNSMFADINGLGFSVAVEENGVEAFRLEGSTTENEHEWAQAIDVPLRGASWRLKVWPQPAVMREMRSNLPLMTLLFGFGATLLLMVIAQFVRKLSLEIAQRRRVEESLRSSQARFAGILQISAEAVISADVNQRITLYNQAAEKTFGYTAQEVMGQSINLLIPERFHAAHAKHVSQFAESTKQSLHMSARRQVFGRRKDGTEFPMAASVSRLDIGGERLFTIICSDVTEQARAAEELRRAHDELELRVRERTADLEKSNQSLQGEILERKRAEEEVHELSRRMMRVQEEERRNLARELHDGATQNLVALALNMAGIRDSAGLASGAQAVIEESVRLVETCTSELRTISYLLHPPLLEELGLRRTLGGYVDGFSRRSGIAVTLTTEGDLEQLGFDVELAVFRIVQECLSNVHRHAHSATASILLSRGGEFLTLEIADQGRGLRPGTDSSGVGIAAMRERVRLLKGYIEIRTGPSGTTIAIRLPLSPGQASSSWAVA